MGRQFSPYVAGGRLAANPRLPQLAVSVLDPLRRVAGGGLSVALHRHLPPSFTVYAAAAVVAKLPAASGFHSAMVVIVTAARSPAGARSALCRLLELSIAAVAAPPSRLFQPRSLAGTYLRLHPMHPGGSAAPVSDADQRLRTGFDQARHPRIPALALLAMRPGLWDGSTGPNLGNCRVDTGSRSSGANDQCHPAAGSRVHSRHPALVFPASPHRLARLVQLIY